MRSTDTGFLVRAFGAGPYHLVAMPTMPPEALPADLQHLYAEIATARQEMAERARIAHLLKTATEATAAVTGHDFIRSLLQHLAETFQARVAFLSEFTDETRTRVRTLELLVDQVFVAPFEYDLEGTPCQTVLEGSLCYFPDQLQALFPKEAGFESYLGVPVYNEAGEVISHLAIVDSKPMHRTEEEQSLMKLFAVRVGVELERDRLMKALEKRVAERTEALQEALMAAQAANRAKSEFLASMSHELRTPLNGILGYAQILLRDETLHAKQRAGVEVIERSGEHLLTLINDVLDLSKIEAGKLDLYLTEFHLPEFLRSLSDIARIRAQQKGLQFCHLPCLPLPTFVQGDERRLRQVLLNLLGNAIKFTDQGTVTLQVGVAEAGSSRLRFSVTDTGVGISQDQIKAIFEPFQQVQDPHRAIEGTGLGLPISLKLVHLMGGTLQATSTPGLGSTFTVELDLPEVATGATPHAPAQQFIVGYDGPPQRVLVVDDRLENRMVLRHLLEPMGFEVYEAENGQQAVAAAEEIPPDLVLLDLVMPVLDGFEAARQMRRMPGLAHTVIIALSASVFDQDRQRSIGAGCNDFIPKPVHAEMLTSALQRHLHLRWRYRTISTEASAGASTPETAPLVGPPAETARVLYELAMIGDVQGLQQHSDLLERADTQYLPFVNALRELARNFDMKQIRAFVKPFLDPAASP
jgi:signal transduction histidine kinase/CheY-like chemotaxis protein